MNTTSLRSLLQQAGEALVHAELHLAEADSSPTERFVVWHEQAAERQLRRAQTLAALAVGEADGATFDARAAGAALLAWSQETGLPLPGDPDLIVALEAAGHTVDLETGRVIRFGADRPLAQVLAEPGVDLARAVELLADPDDASASHRGPEA